MLLLVMLGSYVRKKGREISKRPRELFVVCFEAWYVQVLNPYSLGVYAAHQILWWGVVIVREEGVRYGVTQMWWQ